jgi:hypothetical protein
VAGAAALVAVAAGCSSGDYQSGPPRPAPTTTLAPEVTVRGVVGTFSASARVITLAQPVGGFSNVTLPTETEVVRSNGAKAAVTDLAPRVSVDLTGRPGAPGTLVASRVVLL